MRIFDDLKRNFIVNVFEKSFLLLFQRTSTKMNFKFEDNRKTTIWCKNFFVTSVTTHFDWKNFCMSSHKSTLMNYFELTGNLILRISINIITTSSSKIPRLRATALFRDLF